MYVITSYSIHYTKLYDLNDAKGEIGCNLDRHYHIGLGNIGKNFADITPYELSESRKLRFEEVIKIV